MKYFLILILLFNCISNQKNIEFDKPPDLQETIKEIETLNIEETKKERILEKVKKSEMYGKESFDKMEQMSKRLNELENKINNLEESLKEKDNTIKELESELRFYRTIKYFLILLIVGSGIVYIGYNLLKFYMKLKPI